MKHYDFYQISYSSDLVVGLCLLNFSYADFFLIPEMAHVCEILPPGIWGHSYLSVKVLKKTFENMFFFFFLAFMNYLMQPFPGNVSLHSVCCLLGVVSLTFRELFKIISRKYTMPKITFMLRISTPDFERVPKAWLWAHVQSFSLKFSSEVRF